MNDLIDLRSDTVTRPTPGMRAAMAAAEVGDDVFGDDPTVAELERRVAALLAHEAALFVPSGTMGNAVAVRCHTQPGDEVVAEHASHMFNNETGGAAALSGVQIHPVRGEGGIMTAGQIEAAIRSEDVHHSRTTLVAVENTHNFAGGVVWPLPVLREISALARSRGLRFHMDGARLWNASVASGVPLSDYGGLCDSVCVCLSKGLGAPVGSVLVGPRPWIDRARRIRKMLGGGMRQVGILAAAGLYALDHHLDRLQDDHANARRFADAACRVPGVRLAQSGVETNMVFLDVAGTGRLARDAADALRAAGVALCDIDEARIRAVFHLEITASHAVRAAEILAQTLAGAPAANG